MLVRTISGLIMTAFGVFTLIIGGNFAGSVVGLISIFAYYELCRACGVTADNKKINALSLIGYISIILYYVNLMWGDSLLGEHLTGSNSYDYFSVGLIVTATILGMLGVYVTAFPKFKAGQIAAAMFGLLYAPYMLSYLYMILRDFEIGKYLVFLVFVPSSISDACAYFVGVTLGKHKLAPKLSPKKSIEGSIGGIVGAALVGAVYGLILAKNGIADDKVIWIFTLIGGFGSIIGQIGDLAASAIKRDADIKDYSKLIPGHGGIMDRMDSILVAAPIIYYFSKILF